jgi:hypothetical protein
MPIFWDVTRRVCATDTAKAETDLD